MQIRLGLTYDDVLLIPRYSEVSPRNTDLRVNLAGIKLELPFLSAPMDTVTEYAMAKAMSELGGLGVIHKNMAAETQAGMVKQLVADGLIGAASVGGGDEEFERAKLLVEAGARMIVVDSAHGHAQSVLNQVKRIKKAFGKRIVVVGGNVASGAGTKALIAAGADVVKVGVGPGSICTTRVIAGVGAPQLTAVMDAVAAAKKTKTPIIADGGIKYSGDIVKALAAGATVVMAGGLFAGTDEAPGEVITKDGKKLKMYRGMGSADAMEMGSKDRYGQKDTTDKKKLVAEGIVGYTDYKGAVGDVVFQLAGGLRAGMGYNGAKNLKALATKPDFIQITSAGFAESHPHSLKMIESSSNYKK